MKLHKLSEKQYLKNPEKWLVHFTGWGQDGRPYAMAEKIKSATAKTVL
jgi:hypothetical protein